MKRTLLLLFIAGAVAVPAIAQEAAPLVKRVDTLEKQMKAVQRKVFPGGDTRFFEPEIAPTAPTAPAPGMPASTPVADLAARVDTLEQQLKLLTGQNEQNGHRIRQLEEAVAKLQAAAAPPVAAPPAAIGVAPSPPTAAAAPGAAPADPIDAEYRAAYALVDQKRYAEATTALKAFATKYPKHKRASYARHWLGRTYLADGKPALAVETFYANYQDNPRGDRAPDSLYWLGQALVQLKKPDEACRVYDELTDVYGKTMSATLKDQTAKARVAAKCAA